MKIVVLDGYTLNPGDLSWDGIEKFGELTVYDRVSYDEKDEDIIAEKVGDAEIVFTNNTPVTRRAMEKMHNLRYIGVLATGYNIVDGCCQGKGSYKIYRHTVRIQWSLQLQSLLKCAIMLAHSDSVFRERQP